MITLAFLKYKTVLIYLAGLLAANLMLLGPPANPFRVLGAVLLIGFLPGWSWTQPGWPDASLLMRFLMAAASSFIFTLLATLPLHYLPGPIHPWQLLLVLNLLAIFPLLYVKGATPFSIPTLAQLTLSSRRLVTVSPLLLTLLIALFLRGYNLGYSEFQGDEALAMISAAEALEGHEDALFLRAKGPGEVLLPMALWRLTGVIDEPVARLPFTIASLGAILTIYLIGQTLAGHRTGWIAAAIFSLSGFTVAFGRIVQYQALVLWFSSLAFLLVLRWAQTGARRFALLGGLCLGAGLLAHYDAILALPALGWLFLTTADHRPPTAGLPLPPHSSLFTRHSSRFTPPLLFLLGAALVALPFYLPYSLDPQANRTGEYVGGRIGNELRNNLPEFFHFNSFYSSFYYIALTGLLVFGVLWWRLWQTRRGRPWLPILLGVAGIAVAFRPDLLAFEELNLAFLPFALLFAGAFFRLPFNHNGRPYQALIAWLAVPFLGYNFIVALGLTHIYTIVPAWSLVAALALVSLPTWPTLHRPVFTSPFTLHTSHFIIIPLFLLSSLFLWNAFVRHDVEYWQDYPAGNLALFWSPYAEPPAAGFFGFAHRTGWKAVGQKIVSGKLQGDYSSNEEPDVTAWYTRGAPRACDPLPEYYFLADDLVDPVETPAGLIETNYTEIGRIILPTQKIMRIMQQQPAGSTLGEVDETNLARAFDQTATPAAFARSVRGSGPLTVNFSNLIRLVGYDLDTRRAYPGGRVPVTLYWQALQPVPASYQVFTHLESEAAGLVAQADGIPVCWTYPTDLWRPGQIIADQHAIPIPPEAPPGRYPLQVGLYLPDTLARLDILDEAGHPAGTSWTVAEVEIKGSTVIGN